jgi:nucleotide-binding universal stress UspA family protein
MFKKVIWATDGSEHADRAMGLAVEMAKADGAELCVVHIVEKLLSGRASGMDAFANEDQIRAKIEQQAKTLADEGLQTTTRITAGMGNRIGDRIAAIAQDDGADLIVVGTRGHGALGAMMLGGVTQRLLHVSHCPVLAVPPLVPVEAGAAAEPAASVS